MVIGSWTEEFTKIYWYGQYVCPMMPICMPYDANPPLEGIQRNKNLVAFVEERGLEVFLSCDTNSHHIGWGSTDINLKEESLHDFVMGTGLTILNRNGTHLHGLQKT
ncbi:hypothetical protein P5V15_001090 [Pogonomyrmex californicus]